MTAFYIIGGAISAAMWIGLIYVVVVEPVRLYLRDRKGVARFASANRVFPPGD
jgi:hypothetical protein